MRALAVFVLATVLLASSLEVEVAEAQNPSAPSANNDVGKRVAIVGLTIGGDGAPELQGPLAESVSRGVAAAGAEVVSLQAAQVLFRTTPELAGCVSSTCLARLSEKLGATRFIQGALSAEGADYNLKLELYDESKLLHRIEKDCTVCTLGEMRTLAENTAKLLIESASDSSIQVVIRTEPSGSEITIDGIARGPAPFEGPLAKGLHLLVARAPSGAEIRKRIEISDSSATEPIVIVVEPPTISGGLGEPESPIHFGPWKWVTAGAAVGAVGLGVTLIAIDGNPTCSDEGRQCPRLRNTLAVGLVSVGAGLALGAAAGYMIWSDRELEKQEQPQVIPAVSVDPSGAWLGVRGTF